MFKNLLIISGILFIFSISGYAQVGLLDNESESQAPIREGEKPVIPLDTGDPTYNAWQKLRDFSKDPKREPGPINIQKYDFGYSWMGIPTFFRLPVALTPEDLKAGKVEVAIMGAYTDMSGGMRGAAHGPSAFRNSEVYGGWGIVKLPNMHVMLDPLKEMVCVDYGDAPVDIMSTERSIHAIRGFVRRLCAESNVVGFELVELNPLVDPTYVSAMNANRIVREALTGMAMRKLGLTGKHYLSPLSTDHGQGIDR
jgi:agmatinase